jgi:hypothetical protein
MYQPQLGLTADTIPRPRADVKRMIDVIIDFAQAVLIVALRPIP